MREEPRLSRESTRKHWALYAVDKYEADDVGHRDEGASAADIYQMVGGGDSIIFKSVRDTFDGLIGCDEDNLVEWRTVPTDFSDNEWRSYRFRLTPKGGKALLNTGRPTKKPMRMEENYSRDLPAAPNHDPQAVVLDTPSADDDAADTEPDGEPDPEDAEGDTEDVSPDAEWEEPPEAATAEDTSDAEYDGDVTTEGVDEAVEELAGDEDDKDVDMSQRDEEQAQREDAVDDWLVQEDESDWLTMDVDAPRVYWRNEGDRYLAKKPTSAEAMMKEKSVEDAAAEMAEAYHDGWDIVVTVGPHRMQDAMYRVHEDTKRIHLDFYSVRPGTEYVEEIIRAITRDLRGDGGAGTRA